MDRREALSVVSLIFGGTIVGAGNFLSGCKESAKKQTTGMLNKPELKIIEDLAEIILPKTSSSPGAKEVEIGTFINSIVSDCYDEVEQKAFIAGLKKLDEISILNYDEKFMALSPVNKTELLLLLESESKTHNQNIVKGEPLHYYSMMKQLTIWGYLSSETVGTKILKHIPIPGRYDGCLPYEKGEKAWS